MNNRKSFFCLILCGALVALLTCRRQPQELKRVEILPNQVLSVKSGPTLLATNLDNPQSPVMFEGNVVFSQSAKGEVSMVPKAGGPVKPLITGFAFDDYAPYKISVQCVVIDPATKQWFVCDAVGAGRLLAFTPSSFPTTAAAGREVKLEGAVADNPYDAVIPGRIIIASGGTAKAYSGLLEITLPEVLRPLFEVKTGITGLAVDPRSGDVFGAVFGTMKPDGSIIRFKPGVESPALTQVASGFTNLVDVAFTPDGTLLALEFGSFIKEGEQTPHNGAVYIVATDGSGKVTPFIRGLANPSGLSITPNGELLITEFGTSLNSQRGNLMSLTLGPARGAQ